MIHNILHISDLHFNSDDKSYLTENSDKFIEEIIKEINSVESKIDYLFITGDIVDRGNWNNSDIVLKVINKLETDLEVKNTFCINGNHDLKDGLVSDEFKSFRSKLKVRDNSTDGSWFRTTEINKNHWIIEIDCFINGEDKSSGTGYKALSNAQISEYENFLKKNCCEEEQTLFFLTHLPVKIDPNSELAKDKRFENRNIWPDGKGLIKLTHEHANVSMISWFAGDGHIVDAYKNPDKQDYFFLTGRFNGPFEFWGKDRDKKDPKEAQCQFVRTDSLKKEVIRAIKFSTTQEHYGLYSVKWYSKTLDFISNVKFVNRYFETWKQEELRKKIIDAIDKKKMYELTKATTRNKNVTIGRVDIHKLLNYSNIFKEFLETSFGLIKSEYKSNFKDCVFVGLGYWGGAISSFLGTAMNIPSFCIKVRPSLPEDIKEELQDFVKDKTVFVATDVVASGETLEYVRKMINVNEISCLVTVMLNPFIEKKLRGVSKIIYGSNEISFPVLDQQDLPESIIKSKFSF